MSFFIRKPKNRVLHEPPSAEALKERLLQATINDMYTPQLLLANENAARYRRLLTSYVKEWNPLGQTERDLLTDMVNARWRIRRGWGQLAGLINSEMFVIKDATREAYEPVTAELRQADAVSSLHDARPGLLGYVRTSEATLKRLYNLAMRQLFELQSLRLGHPPVLIPQPPEDDEWFADPVSGQETATSENTQKQQQGPKLSGQQVSENPETFDEFSQYIRKEPFPWVSRFAGKQPNSQNSQEPPTDKAA